MNACQDAILESVSVGEEFEGFVWSTGGVLIGRWVKDEFDCEECGFVSTRFVSFGASRDVWRIGRRI